MNYKRLIPPQKFQDFGTRWNAAYFNNLQQNYLENSGFLLLHSINVIV